MHLVTFRQPGGEPRAGVMTDDRVVDLSTSFRSVHEVILRGEWAVEQVRALAADGGDRTLPSAELELLAPIPLPSRNLFATGWNYVEHFEEGDARSLGQADFPLHPTFFSKLPSTVVGTGAPVAYDPQLTVELDYEAELVVVIGRQGRNIPPEHALEHVFGYTIANDVSARDVQRAHGGQWFRGKSLDGTCPMGPAIVTADEIPDPQDLQVRCEVNGDLRQDASTSTMAFDIVTLISELSRGLTLVPGDLLLTGTPAGVGYARKPPMFLRGGDEVVVSISRLGTLRTPVVADDLTSYVRG